MHTFSVSLNYQDCRCIIAALAAKKNNSSAWQRARVQRIGVAVLESINHKHCESIEVLPPPYTKCTGVAIYI